MTTTPDKTMSVDTDALDAGRRQDPEAQFAPGTIIGGRYRIIGLLGSGGMGEVFRADDMKLGQPVALKFLPAGRISRNPGGFYEEVRLGRLVTHPNVCRLYDIAECDGIPFVAMEYVEGEDLSRLLKRIGRFAPDKAIDIARGTAAGLMAAHAKGVLHRDLKPANVMIDSLGDARIMDFGLAVSAGQQKGVLAGTPAYIAPEQLEGSPASVQSDLYALGLVMYEIVTGHRVHGAKSFDERLRDLGSEIPKPSSLIGGIDPALETIILRCLSPDPAGRPQSAREVIEALPGGDPMAAAMAAGRTPSPRLVAAAGKEGSLRPAMAWSLIGLIAIEIGFAFHAIHATDVFGMLHPKSPELLSERAAGIRGSVGLPSQEFEARGWQGDPQHLAWIAAGDESPQRWNRLKKGPAPIWFWARSEAAPLIRDGPELAPSIIDPPQVTPGASSIALDPKGRLLSLAAVPQTAWQAHAPDWRILFAAAGLDFKRFAATEPRTLPPAYADARAAWNGRHPDDGTPIRVEAAAWHGTPVFFRIVGPWDEAQDETSALPFEGNAGRAYGLATGVVLLAFALLGILLAWRNLRLGRGDRAAATRMALVLFALQLISTIGFADHAWSVLHETTIILRATATTLLWTAGYFLVYLGLEPFVRRRWPDRLIAWARLMSGDWRDPMIGRDLLIGIAAGMAHVTLALTPFVLGIAPHMASTSMLQNAFAPIAGMANLVHYAIVQGLTLMIALMILTILLRRRRLAALGVFALLLVVFHFASADPRMLPVFAGGAALVTFVVARFGLLASVAYCATFFLFATNTLPTGLEWYTTRGLVAPAMLAILAVWAFHTSLGERSPWRTTLLETELLDGV
jgi:serine/threonine-protein kinase